MFAAARLGDLHLCPIPGHGTTPIVTASATSLVNGKGRARVGDVCGCGAALTVGIPSILIDGRPMAYLGSTTSHGGTLISGSPDTFGGLQGGKFSHRVIIDFAKLNAVGPDGMIYERRMATLLADPRLTAIAKAAGAIVDPQLPAPKPVPTKPPCDHPDQLEEPARYIAEEMNRNLHHPTVAKIKSLLSYDIEEERRKWLEQPFYTKMGGQPNFHG
ncbi:MAG TPA: PAAR domain-containing protein, partial [Pseudomonas sp.]